MKFFFKAFSFLLISTIIFQESNAQQVASLFNSEKKNDWHIYISKLGRNDSNHVFQFEQNVLHVSGENFGYIVTEKKYADFHFSVEFKWGEKKYPPREKSKRDAGVLYHVDFHDGEKVWPRSLEFQIQEGDCGDFWMTDSTIIYHADTLTPPMNWHRAMKFKDAEKPTGEWNKAEIIVQKGKITHMLNGEVVNSGRLVNTNTGYIILQSEGAEIYYRNAQIQEL